MSVYRCECAAYIEWHPTVYGRRLPFDSVPVPITEDVEGTGWIAGRWRIFGRMQIALAPVEDYDADYRASAKRVLRLHESCPRYKQRITEVLERRWR